MIASLLAGLFFFITYLATKNLTILDSVVSSSRLLLPLPPLKSTWYDRYLLYFIIIVINECLLASFAYHGSEAFRPAIGIVAWPWICDHLMNTHYYKVAKEWVYDQVFKLAKKTLCLSIASITNQVSHVLLDCEPRISRKEIGKFSKSLSSVELVVFIKTLILANIVSSIKTSRPILLPVVRTLYNRGMIAEWSSRYQYEDVYPEIPGILDKLKALLLKRELHHLMNPGFLVAILQAYNEAKPDPAWQYYLKKLYGLMNFRSSRFLALWTIQSVGDKLFPHAPWYAWILLALIEAWPIREDPSPFNIITRLFGLLTLPFGMASFAIAEFGQLLDCEAFYWFIGKLKKKTIYLYRRLCQRSWLAFDLFLIASFVWLSSWLNIPLRVAGYSALALGSWPHWHKAALLAYFASFGYLSNWNILHIIWLASSVYFVYNLFWPVEKKITEESIDVDVTKSYYFVPKITLHSEIIPLEDNSDDQPKEKISMKRIASALRPFPKWMLHDDYPE